MIQDITFIVCGYEYRNQTTGSIKFDKWGEPIDCDIRYISEWNEVIDLKFLRKYIFCLKSGTIFTDISKFFDEITPALLRTGLGHIIFDRIDNEIYLHDQAFLLESNMLSAELFNEDVNIFFPNFKCSAQHIHDDYTPLSVMLSDGQNPIKTSRFGQNILKKYLLERKCFNNFPKKLRQYKLYFRNKDIIDPFYEYNNMIKNTLWVFNNEKISVKKSKKVLCTGGGIGWMLQTANDITICDISVVQTDFIKKCIHEWDGDNFGKFVFDFILNKKIKHFHINLDEQQNSATHLLKNRDEFILKINNNFYELVKKYRVESFCDVWRMLKNKKIVIKNSNLLEHVKEFKLEEINLSNLLDFKYNFVTDTIKTWQNLISPATKVFIKSCAKIKKNPYKDPPCELIEMKVPVNEIYGEILQIKKFFVQHREKDSIGWSSFCIHGKSFDATREDNYYNDDRAHVWTQEALKYMPTTIDFLKSLNFIKFHRVRVMCLEPRGFINIHRDQDESNLGPINIAINHPKNCKFYLEHHGELVFRPGVAYRLNLVNYHAVINYSDTPRYHIIVHGIK